MPEYLLREELRRRAVDQAAGACDYCQRPLGSTPSCKLEDRHNAHPRVENQSSPAAFRLIQVLRDRSGLLLEVLKALGVPLLKCEGHGGPCEGQVLWPTGSMTAYVDMERNKDLMLCPACSEMYTSDMKAQWADYNSGRL